MATHALRDARRAAGLSCREVAAAAGLSWSAIAHFETGRLNPSPDSKAAWQAAVKVLLADRILAITDSLINL